MSVTTVATWNVAEGLGHTDRSPEIVEAAKRFDADVMAFPDAYWLDNPLHTTNDPEQVEIAKESFAQEGYEAHAVQYDRPGHFPGRHLLLLSRVEGEFDVVDAAGLATARLTIPAEDGASLQIVGVHFDDQSEDTRVQQAEELAVNLSTSSRMDTVVIGDFNAMNGLSRRARLLRSFVGRSAARLSSDLKPRNAFEEQNGRPSKMKRLVDMADGRTMQALFDSSLRDADKEGRATVPDKLPLFSLDHIMVSQIVHVDDYQVHPATGLSDHRAVSAKLLNSWDIPGTIPRDLGW